MTLDRGPATAIALLMALAIVIGWGAYSFGGTLGGYHA